MPDESPRVFLSYGVRDASQIAERLHCDLAARGFEIWQDVKRLRRAARLLDASPGRVATRAQSDAPTTERRTS